MLNSTPQYIIDRLRADLLEARKARDPLTSSVLQTVIAAIDNAGAVPIAQDKRSVGVGSTGVARRELSAQDIQEVIKSEIAELQQAIQEVNGTASTYVNDLSMKVVILNKYLTF